jgi:molybdopterin/thiamine biosynthesis adenylyltransferase
MNILLRMQEMAFQGFKFQKYILWENTPDPCSNALPSGKPPPPLTNQARSAQGC